MLPKLAVVITHPIQYYAPIFRLLTERGKVQVKVFYTWEQAKEKVYDVNFKREIKWDIPLLDGYEYTFVKNVSTEPGSHHFKGINNPSLIGELLHYKPDGILIFGWSFKSHLQAMRYFKGKVPVLFRGDSTLLDDVPGIRSLIRKLFLRWVYSHVDIALYVGERSKAYFINNGLVDKQLIFAPHAIDNERFKQLSVNFQSENNLRKKLKIDENDLVFLFAGKLERKKNPLLLAKAFSKLDLPHTHLVLVGNGKLEKTLKQEFSGNARVHFVDFQNQKAMPATYGLADVFVLPSAGPGETWGLAVNEAMACSKPILVSDKCGCAIDLVEDGVNGYTFQSENEDDLCAKLDVFSKFSTNELSEMGKKSYEIIQDWSFDNICNSIESSLH